MILIKESPYFAKWLVKLKDNKAKIAIFRRLNRVRHGNFGDHKALGDGLYELRFTIGAGYRIYYMQKGDAIVILLAGGDKSSQTKDIKKAKELMKEYKDG